MAERSDKSLFFVACTKKMKRYCYKIEDNNSSTRRKRKRRCCCCCCTTNHHHHHRSLFNRRVLEPITDGCEFYINEWGTYLALGSTIYCIGGYRRHGSMTEVNTVLSFDTSRPQSGWKLTTPMIVCRGYPRVAAIDGKIYVFGGRGECKPIPWGEVFDPRTDTWEPLPDPPIPLSLEDTNTISAAVVDTKMVVLASNSGVLYGLNVLANTWEFLFVDESLGFRSLVDLQVHGLAVVFDNSLYWYVKRNGKHKLEAYDLEKRMWFTGSIEGLEWDGLVTPPHDPSCSDRHNDSSPNILHLQRNLWCLVWEDNRAYKDKKKSKSTYRCIDSIKFKATKRINSRGYGVLDLRIQSSEVHLIHPSSCFEHAFLI